MNKTLEIRDLHVEVAGIEILRGVNLVIPPGEIHAMMGPNGSGKSTLANTLMGHPNYQVTSGQVIYGGEDLLSLSTDQRAKEGLFLAFQYPHEIAGVRLQDFLRTASMAVHPQRSSLADFSDAVDGALGLLDMNRSYLNRSINEGFSGGEKKRAEILQMIISDPTLAILDETDSGLDVDALKLVSEGVNSLRSSHFSALVITHYQRILNYLKPDFVHVMHHGRIVRSGDCQLAKEIETHGYEMLKVKSEFLAG